ncbi:MAG TPA: hypothetical protein VI231_06055 [Candidatus Binatia bacterium]|jgi:hypothetical protein
MSEPQPEVVNPPAASAPDDKEIASLRALFADLSNRRQRAFLAGFLAGESLKRAEDLADVSRWCHYQWMKSDALYRERFRLAKTILTDEAEEEAYRRAFLGYDAPVVYGGKITAWYKSYSDALAQFLLKGMRPEIYGPGAADRPMGPTEMTIRVVRPEDREKDRAEERAEAEATRTISIPIGTSDSSTGSEEDGES